MGEREIGEFITHPAKNEKVSATTQNQVMHNEKDTRVCGN
jgi:hypothetical protein